MAEQPTEEKQVGCEGTDGLLRIHGELETCDVCNPSADQGDTIEQLKRFYGVETLEQLVLAQNRHVERLQETYKPRDQPLLPKPREG